MMFLMLNDLKINENNLNQLLVRFKRNDDRKMMTVFENQKKREDRVKED